MKLLKVLFKVIIIAAILYLVVCYFNILGHNTLDTDYVYPTWNILAGGAR